jgi:hypothetical protein
MPCNPLNARPSSPFRERFRELHPAGSLVARRIAGLQAPAPASRIQLHPRSRCVSELRIHCKRFSPGRQFRALHRRRSKRETIFPTWKNGHRVAQLMGTNLR